MATVAQKAHQQLGSTLNKMADIDPYEWQHQALSIVGIVWGDRKGREPDNGGEETETTLIRLMGELSAQSPDWLMRVVRMALLVELKLRENG